MTARVHATGVHPVTATSYNTPRRAIRSASMPSS